MYDKKYDLGNPSEFNTEKKVKNVYFGEVISIDDDTESMRIKVRVTELDDKIKNNEELPLCIPYLPKFFFILPRIGEAVEVLIADINYPYRNRFWIGPLISQPQKINNDPYYFSALSITDNAKTSTDSAPKFNPNATGIYPTINDVGLIGRNNTDILLKDREVEIRAGKHVIGDNLFLNRKNPSYHKLLLTEDGNTSYNMNVADKIGLISHKSKNKFNPILDSDELIRFFDEAHPLAKGDILVRILETFRNAIISHIHGGSNIEADDSNFITKLKEIDLKTMLSDNIRIN